MKSVSAATISPEQLQKLVRAELDKTGHKADSIGTPIKVTDFGEKKTDFLIVPITDNGKLVSVYRDDPMRSSVTLLASEAVLKSEKLPLFTLDGARREFANHGFTGSDPIPVSFGPFSLFGVMGVGWLFPTKDSFVLLSLEGRMVTESDVAKFWPTRLESVRLAMNKIAPKP